MYKTILIAAFIGIVMLSSCSNYDIDVSNGVKGTLAAFTAIPTLTEYPTNTSYPTYTPIPTYTIYPTYTPGPTLTPRIFITMVMVTMANTPTEPATSTKTTIPTRTPIPTRTLVIPTSKPHGMIISGTGFFIVGVDIMPGNYIYKGGGSDSCFFKEIDRSGNALAYRIGNPDWGFVVGENVYQVTLSECGEFEQQIP